MANFFDLLNTGSALMPSLAKTESGGNWQAQNNEVGAGGQAGHFGRAQFGKARLQEAMDAGAIPPGTTPQQFMQSPELQKSAENWHFADIDGFIKQRGFDSRLGETVNGAPITMEGMRAVAHLGGKGGLDKFINTGGKYNPADANGTSLMNYFTTHAGKGGDQANVPAEGGTPAEGKSAGPVLAQGFAPPAAEPSIWEKLSTGGPGALFGAPQKGWNFADALSGASVAMLARDKPEAAMAMAKALGVGAEKKASNLQMGNFDKERGTATFFNPQTGQTSERQVATPAGKELTEKARQTIYDRDHNVSIVSDNLDKAHFFRDKITSGELDVSLLSSAENRAKAMANMAPEKAQLYVQYEQFIKEAANSALRLNKGVQTDKDYDRTLQGLTPDITRYDNKLTISALDTIVDRSRREFGALRRANESSLKDYGSNAPSGDYLDRYKNLGDRADGLDKDEAYIARRKAFMEGKAGAPAASSSESPRVGAAQSNGGKSFADQMREDMLRKRQGGGN